ncbi:MAG: O-antigen translocase [Aurantimonas endophytica]|uniref:O-antigen translocase n=1 Tax=Aurantimonas endophytica TaxID=1522175 RepID=UPI003001DF1E
MAIIGSAQTVKILILIVRLKVVALLLGPAGIGLLSLYTSLQSTVGTTAGLGMGSSGVRQIASVKGEEQALSRVRRVLLAAHLVQGLLAMVIVWVLREPLAEWLLGSRQHATAVGLVGVATLLGLLSTAQTALLQGMRRIGDLGRVTVLGTLVGTLAGLACVWLYGAAGLIGFVLVQPLATIAIALRYTSRLPKPTARRPGMAETWEIWKPMAKLGSAFMLGGLATTGTLLLIRSLITQELGLDAAGQFAAAWGITMTYVGFLLGAMGADYYPRLTEVIHDRAAATRLMNDQAQLGLAIGGPVLLLLIGLAPFVITLLYSAEFGAAATLLQWQTVGNVFKLASWALGFAFIAAAQGTLFLLLQVNFNVLFLAILWLGLGPFGLVAAGPAFMVAYMLHFVVLAVLAHRLHGFRWERLSLALLALHAGLALLLLALTQTAPLAAALASPVLALATGALGLRIVLIKTGPEGSLAAGLTRIYATVGWPVEGRT